MSNKRKHKEVSRWANWTGAVDTVQNRAYSARRKVATVAATVLAIFMGFHVVFGHNGLTAYEQKRENTRALQLQMQDLQRENDRLRGHVDRLQNDPGAIEHQAREELHYTRAGEVIYTLPPDPKPPAGQTASKP
jgi:cell division protein FtsB